MENWIIKTEDGRTLTVPAIPKLDRNSGIIKDHSLHVDGEWIEEWDFEGKTQNPSDEGAEWREVH